MSPKTKTLAGGLIVRTSSMLDKKESRQENRGSPAEVFLWWGILGGCRGFGEAGEYSCIGMVLIELHSNSVGIMLLHGYSLVGLLCFSWGHLVGARLDNCFWMKLYSCITFSVKLLIKSWCKYSSIVVTSFYSVLLI